MWDLRERPDHAVPFRFETTRPKQMVQHAPKDGAPAGDGEEVIEFHRSNADSALGIRIKPADDAPGGVDTVRCYHFGCITGLLPICSDVVTLKQNEIAFRGFVGLTKEDSRRLSSPERQHQICLIVNGSAYQSPPFVYCAGNTKGYRFVPSQQFSKWKAVDIVGRNNNYLPPSGEKIVCPQCEWETYPTAPARAFFLNNLDIMSPENQMELEAVGTNGLDTSASNAESENNDESRSAVEHLIGMRPIQRARVDLDFVVSWDHRGALTVSGQNLPVFRDETGEHYPTAGGTQVVIQNPSLPLWAQVNLSPSNSTSFAPKKRGLKKPRHDANIATNPVEVEEEEVVDSGPVPQETQNEN